MNIDGEEVKMKMSKKELIEGRKMKNKMEQIMNDIIISGLPFIIVGIIKKTKISDKSERYANENESNHTYIDEDEIRARSVWHCVYRCRQTLMLMPPAQRGTLRG